MIPLVREKQKAIELRKKGYSYRDILSEMRVAKSSLSLWLKDLPLTDEEKAFLKNRRRSNISRGRIRSGAALRRRRMDRENIILNEAKAEFIKFCEDPLFYIGVSLYWAEGSKRNNGFGFTNSDGEMQKVMISWIEKYLKVPRNLLQLRLYTHKPFAHEHQEEYWQNQLGVDLSQFRKTVYKPTGLLVKKRPAYKGCLRIITPEGRKNLLKMLFWQQMLIDKYKHS